MGKVSRIGRHGASVYSDDVDETSTAIHRNEQLFEGKLVFKAQRLLYHSTLGLNVIENKKNKKTISIIGTTMTLV